ncbi:Bifunctional uridylyltransferase/uridylyl-removing enzyme [Botrimarina hoheduenensis]|uniref:Bifunctional uridylyltransferase/uridylyl-removing enzyme n=2 Tax=Botrimarina hoheduenensis TaxID=2528000 RepID=A0A5C5W0D0_9BACT|nr:Bifunctional uridylyltransferase/uridylyl-removing enzyme [Botrimarina hoheduenensis]
MQVCGRLTTAVDTAIETLWKAALADLPDRQARLLSTDCALVAHGGYGRRQLAPLSDIDLMVLHQPGAVREAEQLTQRLTRDIFDVGLDLGQSLRTIDDALQMAKSDAVVATSLVESRLVVGDASLVERFKTAYSATLQRRGRNACKQFVAARKAERDKYGETVYLLEPNLKRSRGALRDVHLLRWLWYVQTGVCDLDRLHSMGVISKFDHHRLCSSRDFLLRVRNDLHFGAARASDTLHRAEQLRIAKAMGYSEGGGLRAVERFMRDYFRHAAHVSFLTTRVADLTTANKGGVSRVLEPVLSRAVAGGYRVGFNEVTATAVGLDRLRRMPEEAIKLVEVARDTDRRIAQETWYAVYRAAPDYPTDVSPETGERFLKLLAKPIGLGTALKRLHELAVLERIVPALARTRCLLQFNQYHKFTVDEHCLRSVDQATRFAERQDTLGEVYRQLPNKALLHLALLLHDLGKGQEGDHSVTGEAIARRTAARLRLDDADADQLALLVRQHLAMSLLAFRRNTNDPDLVAEFAKLVGTRETLAKLFVLTCADMAAVGPGVLNDWKVGVLSDLYLRTDDTLADVRRPQEDRHGAARTAVWQILRGPERDDSLLKEFFGSLPVSFVAGRSPGAVASTLRRLKRVYQTSEGEHQGQVEVWGNYLADGRTLELIAAIADGAGRGVFSAMAGALASKGLSILSAETTIVAHGVLLLRYAAEDSRMSEATNAAEANRRVQSLCAAATSSIGRDEPPVFPQVWGADRHVAQAALTGQPDEVRIDTTLSDECAIVEVFTIDRVGLLYRLARALHELDLVIRFAKIATSLDQVVDVFYVTERDGTKPTDNDRLETVRHQLMGVLEAA